MKNIINPTVLEINLKWLVVKFGVSIHYICVNIPKIKERKSE